jgi:hypothetical protein
MLPLPWNDPADDALAIDGPRAITSVSLARTRGKSRFLFKSLILMAVFFCSCQLPSKGA